MMMNPAWTQEATVKRIEANIHRLAIGSSLPRETFSTLDVTSHIDVFSAEIFYQIRLALAGRKICTNTETSRTTTPTETIRYPASWRGALVLSVLNGIERTLRRIDGSCRYTEWKERMQEKWVEWVVVEKSVTLVNTTAENSHYHLIPIPERQTTNSDRIMFMQWNEPYMGSIEEYHALVEIAERALAGRPITTQLFQYDRAKHMRGIV
jgi:hypothetical protein